MTEKNKTYTAADFARYHAGTMPAGEMHALEKAALEDPFLEDALEGYAYTTSAGTDIEELKSRMAEKRKKKNIFFLSSLTQNKWWRIAALLIVVAGAGYLFYLVNYVHKENTVAINDIKTYKEKKDSVAPAKIDSTITNDIAFEKQPSSNFTQQKAAIPGTRPAIRKESIVSPKMQPVTAYNYSKEKSDDDISFDSIHFNMKSSNKVNYADTSASTGYLLQGKVTDENGNPVPFANIADKSHHKATVTDTAGLFLFQSQDSSITATVSATGYASKSFKLKKDGQPTIAMNKTSAELDEVSVSAAGREKASRKAVRTPGALEGRTAGVQKTSGVPEPYGGREKFDQYLHDNTSPVFNETNERVTGEVFLSFILNKKGRPKNITVIKSSCEACEKEAIDLLQNGPRWTGKKGIPGTVVIKF